MMRMTTVTGGKELNCTNQVICLKLVQLREDLDNNRQSDASGDRGEWDLDNSGGGSLYVSNFDGRIHLYGAEWGAWRIDQNSFSYQGFGGIV